VGVVYSATGEKNAHRLLVLKPEGKRPIGRLRRRWINNIKTELVEMGLEIVDWIGLVQDRNKRRALMNAVIKFRVP
jgi:hypothetical protein